MNVEVFKSVSQWVEEFLNLLLLFILVGFKVITIQHSCSYFTHLKLRSFVFSQTDWVKNSEKVALYSENAHFSGCTVLG